MLGKRDGICGFRPSRKRSHSNSDRNCLIFCPSYVQIYLASILCNIYIILPKMSTLARNSARHKLSSVKLNRAKVWITRPSLGMDNLARLNLSFLLSVGFACELLLCCFEMLAVAKAGRRPVRRPPLPIANLRIVFHTISRVSRASPTCTASYIVEFLILLRPRTTHC